MLVQVNLYGQPIGIVDWDAENDHSIFEYKSDSLKHYIISVRS
jgi:hypothetical protein